MSRIVPLISYLLFITCSCSFIYADNGGSKLEKPTRHNLSTDDPYGGVPYQERPAVKEVTRVLSVDDLLRSNLPTFWKSRKSISDAANVGGLSERRYEIDMLEKDLLAQIQGIPGIPEIIEENRNLEAEIQNFLTLRRAELKDLHKQIRILEKELDSAKQVKAHDISGLQDRIQSLYDDIDTHLESPESSYNDTYILQRKERIKKLLRKKKTLRSNLQKLNDPKIKRLSNRLEFLQERRRELHEKSRDLSFKYVEKRMTMIEKNNARINYLVNINSNRGETKKLKAKMARIRQLRDSLDSERQKLKSTEQGQVDLETEIRFEEKYYDRVAKRESEILEDIRRSRQMIRQGSSDRSNNRVSTVNRGSKADVSTDSPENKASSGKSHVIVVPLKKGMDLSSVGKLPDVLKANPKFKNAREGTVIYMSNDSSDNESAKDLVADVQRDLEEQNLRLSKELGALRVSLEALHKTMQMQQQQTQQYYPLRSQPSPPEKKIPSVVEKNKQEIKSKPAKPEVVAPQKQKPKGLEAAIQSDLEDSDEMGL
tara:strand:- start:1126 stop:2748 length:1623 start_codon:yes stop_codon:yes gene_type:complete